MEEYMKIKTTIILTTCLILSLALNAFATDAYDFSDLPVYPEALNTELKTSDGQFLYLLSFDAPLPYPADDLFDYYGGVFNGIGFIEKDVVDGFVQQKDSERLDKSLARIWMDEEERYRITLIVSTQSDIKFGIVHGRLQVTRFIDRQKISEFYSKLADDGQETAFGNLMFRYTNEEDDNFDMERAMREHPDNAYLREYYELTR
jgi:hypothetical protein